MLFIEFHKLHELCETPHLFLCMLDANLQVLDEISASRFQCLEEQHVEAVADLIICVATIINDHIEVAACLFYPSLQGWYSTLVSCYHLDSESC